MGSKNVGCSLVKSRKFDLSGDYDTLYQWWRAHGSFPPKPEHLSSIGIVVEVENKPICAGFLYNTDSKICVFEFVVSDPKAKKEDRHKSLNILINRIQSLAEELEYTLIYTSINIDAYIKKLKNAGFIEVDRQQVHMFYEIGGKNV